MVRVKYFIFLFIFQGLLLNTVFSQITEDFSDGDYLNNPVWAGDTSVFIVNSSNQLQLYNPDIEGISYLSTTSKSINNAVWEFFVKFKFNPSSSNYCNIYLVADSANLNGSINGYFVKIGTTSDEISLYRQDSLEQTEIIDGRNDVVDSDSVQVNVRVTRDSLGNWQLFADTVLTKNYELEGETFDSIYFKTEYFGLVCIYTKTRADKFFFDNISITGDPFIDSVPPVIINHKSISKNEVWLQFSEEITIESALHNSNYTLLETSESPNSIKPDLNTQNAFILSFLSDFVFNTTYSISISTISDINENNIRDTVITFTHLIPGFGHLLINEIMADPSPSVSLPEYEYIELFNNSGNNINIMEWQLQVNNKFYLLPTYTLNNSEYIIVIPNEAENLFPNSKVVALKSFPSLNNEGASIQLFDKDTNLIHFVNYSENWHENIIKKDGGWSLEMIDPDNPCGKSDNWSSSKSNSGGTPGYKNSILSKNTDIESPSLNRIGVKDNSSLILYINESLNPGKEIDIQSFTVDNNIGNPYSIYINPPEYSAIIMQFQSSFIKNKEYELTITNNFEDCVGNISEDIKGMTFALPDTPAFNDIVINEILFDPFPDGEDFIELYNRSEKVFDLNKLFIATKDIESGEIKDYCKIMDESWLIFPDEYYAFTTSKEKLLLQYYCTNHNAIIEVSNLPNFTNDEGRVAIFDLYQNTIDDFEYDEGMHFELLQNNEGLSLERVHPDNSTNDKSNWHSAAETVGYATPGYQNSHYSETNIENQKITITNNVFSPDNDGYEDFLEINYAFPQPGNVGTIIIFDSKGRIIKTIADNILLDAQGSFIWEGKDEFDKIADIGIYIIYIQIFDLDGNVKKYKKTCVLAKKLN